MRTRSFSSLVLSLTVGVTTLLCGASSALADESPAVPPASAPPASSESEPDVTKPSPKPTGRGVAFGLDNGLLGRSYEQGLRVRLPLGDHFAVNLRGISAMGDRAGDFTWYAGGRGEIIGHTPVYLNLVRLYGGGGPEVVTRVRGTSGDKTAVGFGGQFGFEFFLKPGFSFFAEIGGRSGDELTGGGTVLAGMMLYPFTGR